MRKLFAVLFICVGVIGAYELPAQSTKPAAKKQKASRPPWWLRVLRFAGVTTTPSHQRSDDTVEASGDVWIRDVGGESAMRLLAGNYHSPVFGCRDETVYVLAGDGLYEVNAGGGSARLVLKNAGILKLIGVDADVCDEMLVLTTKPHRPAVLSLKTNDLDVLPIDATADAAYVDYLLDNVRHYGDRAVKAVRTSGILNISFKEPGADWRQLTTCDVGCVQPSLGHGGVSVVYVRLRR